MTPRMLLLIAASMVAMQIVSLFLRREQGDVRPYLGLLGADLGALVGAELRHAPNSALAFVGEAMAAVLLFAPRLCDVFEARALLGERLGAALRVTIVRELLVPGRGSSRRRRRLEQLLAVKEGRAGETARRLFAELDEATDPAESRHIKEELATVLLLGQRLDLGVEFVERNFQPSELSPRPLLVAHLLRAYGERGQLDRAAEMVRLLEAQAEPSELVVQGGLLYLALSGETALVRSVLASAAGGALPKRSVRFLVETSERYASRLVGATSGDREFARGLAERVQGASTRPVEQRRSTRATLTLVAANLLAWLALGPFATVDETKLVRAGALFGPAVMAGEWWRPLSAMFLHASWTHVLVNLYGLYLLGRFAEGALGTERFLLIYLLSGLAGALGSLLAGQGALSVGASGAIMGLLGALIVVLLLRKGRWPEAWRRTLLWNLVFLSVIQIYVGFQMPMIDNGAHIGGLVGGVISALILSPDGLFGGGSVARLGVRFALCALLGVTLVAGIRVASTSLATTLERLPEKTVELGGVRLKVPSHWEVDAVNGRIGDPYLGIELSPVTEAGAVRIGSPQADDPRYREVLDRIARSAVRLP
jgi:membrane associated rhomboid family serine protease